VSHICGFISSAVYEDRLGYQAYTASRVLTGKVPEWLDRPAGLFYVPVEHEGNAYESAEEEDRIASLVNDLLRASVRSAEGATRRLTPDDILIVAPYNLQVRRLERRLPGIRVGSVDKFQGQEAAVVILSMCASAGDSSPRSVGRCCNGPRNPNGKIPLIFYSSDSRSSAASAEAETFSISCFHPGSSPNSISR
jgi:uncharacterized protein